MLRSIAAVIVGYLVFGVSAALLFFLSGQNPNELPGASFLIFSILYGIFFALLGGYLAGLIAGHGAPIHALIVGGIIALIALISALVKLGQGSIWSDLATLILMSPAAFLGGYLRHRLVNKR